MNIIIFGILAWATIFGYLGLTIATIARKQYLYAVGYICALIWVVAFLNLIK